MRTHAPLLPYVFALLVSRSDLLLKELDQCLLGFIEQVKSHIVKRKNPLNNLLSLSEEEIIQLKAKPAEGTTPTSITLDDNPLYLSEINANILSIKNNVSFFFWLTICSLALSMLVILMGIA